MRYILGLMASALALGVASAEPTPVWNFTLENDWAGGSDKNYSGGWQFSRTAILRKRPGRTKFLQIAAAQQFYTPQYDFARRALPDQHPYGALLYGEAKLAFDGGDGKAIDIIGLKIGTIGPSAQGEEVQNFVHDLIGQRQSRGWDNQIGNQTFAQLTAERRWIARETNVGRFELDIVPQVGIAVGNALMAAEAGATVRIGRNLDRPLGEPRLDPSMGGIAWYDEKPAGEGARYAYIGAVARGVSHKIWLDGRWGEDEIVEQNSEPFVYDIQAGFVTPIGRRRLGIAYMHRSETFETFGETQGIGVISISSRF
ncbi:MAG: lipid A deacylase LpxR family protein [Parvularculaceae bacterium]|nr:lipid A deacylase LpxR family protein [Parvularculaceae bacterium]